MSSPIVLVSAFVLCGIVNCNTVTTTDKPDKTLVSTKTDSDPLGKEISWSSVLMERLESMNAMNTEKTKKKMDKTDVNETFNKRNSRFLGSLAFLAGLGVGGLASAASSTVKAYAKLPQGSISMNLVPPKMNPYLAAYYDPFAFVPHPYVYHTPVGLYPLLDPSKLQSLIGGSNQQNGVDRPTQIFTLIDDKRPANSDDNEEDFVAEKTKLKEEKLPSSRLEEQSDDTTEVDIVDEKTEEEISSNAVTCGISKHTDREQESRKDSTGYDFEDLQEVADDSRAQTNVQRNFTTIRPTVRPTVRPTTRPTVRPPPRPTLVPTTQTPPTRTPTTTQIPENNVTYPPFFGYYGGNPQDIGHVDLTSGTQLPLYHEPNPINYNLPYDRPANFYHDDKYNFYSNSYPNSYPSGPYISEQLPDYSRNDFDRFIYSPDSNNPSHANAFKPVT